MSRLKRFASAVVTGYIALAANVLFSLGSIPLALRYLSDEQFGLWSIITLIGTYLALVDLGMSSAFARLLIDHKDDPDQRSYTSLIKSAWLVLFTQAFLVVIVAFIGSWVLPALLKVTPSLQGDFRWLLLAQGGLLAFGFTTKVFPQLLSAHHRLDLVNIGVALGFGVSFFVLWLAFRAGCGVSSLVWAGAASAAFILIFYAFSCLILRIFPKPGTENCG